MRTVGELLRWDGFIEGHAVPEGTADYPNRFNMRRCGFRKLVLDLHDRTLYKSAILQDANIWGG